MKQCIFLDRDGVLNVERGEYTYNLRDFQLETGVPEALQIFKKAGYLLIIITNQAGIAKGIYSADEVLSCYQKLQQACDHAIDEMYFSPHHPLKTESLTRKPDSLMFEKAIAKFKIDPSKSWMIGDKERDLIPAEKLGIKGVRITHSNTETIAKYVAKNLLEASRYIVKV
ncbi:D-glycero-alpha-D-manno-heptose-1,7-bisphosphate 7-phosphatase [Flexithrix dorotheae]|uniref:D-glycero-alpha-D-manno-heptose-1,7-bisphosphate 7-phosphatase n=1 Tax=Flexithrix dorotheae TaxID=70993 RepID=UPI000371CBFB|nr:HAD-IIIA family hydrolase [Flexithrix dorotheae]